MENATDILICGDLCPTDDSKKLFKEAKPEGLFTDVLPVINQAKFVMANLEFVLTDDPKPAKKTGPILHGPTQFCDIIKKAGIDLLTLANNHVKDCGEEGVKSSIATCATFGIDTYGAGENLREAKKPYFTEVAGKKIAFIVFAEQEFNCASETEAGANYFDPYEDLDLIQSVKKQVDYLVVIYHGGIEHYTYPSPLLQKKCRKFVDKGADLVTCQHSHCIGTIENYKERSIVYGQGNTVFGYRAGDDSWNQGMLLKLKVENEDLKVSYQGITALKEGGIRLMTKIENEVLINQLEIRSQNIKDPLFIKNSWLQFCLKKESIYLPQYLGLNRYLIHLNRWTKNKLVTTIFANKYLRSSHNIMRCEAHNEVIQTILKNQLSK